MSELTKTHRPIHAADEGYDRYSTNTSTRRYQTQGSTANARRADRVPSRASRPHFDAVRTQDDIVYLQRQGPRTHMPRPTSDVYDPHYQARTTPQSYVYPDDRMVDDPQTEPGRYNRWQRRQKLTPGQMAVLQWFCKVVLAALLLYCLGSLAFTFYVARIGNPMAFGPEHGNVITLHDGSQEYYLQGLNNHGQTEIIEIPVGHPNTSKIYLGPSGGPTNADANVHLEMKDINHDGHADIIEHIEPEGFHWLFTPQPSNDFVFLNDSHDQFKLQQSNQGGE